MKVRRGRQRRKPPCGIQTGLQVSNSMQNTPVPKFLPGKFHGERNLAGYSPWGCKDPFLLPLGIYFLRPPPVTGSQSRKGDIAAPERHYL